MTMYGETKRTYLYIAAMVSRSEQSGIHEDHERRRKFVFFICCVAVILPRNLVVWWCTARPKSRGRPYLPRGDHLLRLRQVRAIATLWASI